jgi:hypothetical protein
METTNIVDFARRDGMTDALTELLRTGAQQLIATAVEAEFASYLAQFSDLRTNAGHAAVVRNGHHPERPLQTSIGPVSVRIPKVRSKDGTPVTFRSALVPPYVRRTKTLEAALPWLYLKGISSGEMGASLKVLLGPDAAGLSANTVSRLKRDWAKEYDDWKDAAFDDEPSAYSDGVDAPYGIAMCQGSVMKTATGRRPWTRLAQLGLISRRTFFTCMEYQAMAWWFFARNCQDRVFWNFWLALITAWLRWRLAPAPIIGAAR